MIPGVDIWDIRSLGIEPRQPKVLRSDQEARVIAINLPAGEALQEHQVHERAYLVVADGEIEVEQDGRTETGGCGFLSHFQANERHEVRAKSDALLVLILVPWPGEGHSSWRAAGGDS
jgi:quercetin dioxygenase-like cupin family protein